MEDLDKLNETLSSLIEERKSMESRLESINEKVNMATQKLINILSKTLVGEFVKIDCDDFKYGVIHSVIDLNTVNIIIIGLTAKNKLNRRLENFDMSRIEIVSEDEVFKSIFDSIKEKYKCFIKEE